MSARRTDGPCPRFAGLPAGVGVPCRAKAVGRRVTLRGGREVEVLGCAVPEPRPRASKRSQCTPDFLTRDELGAVRAVRGSIVRERLRERSELCDLAQPFERRSGFGAQIARAGYVGAELPYPHRRGGSPCCAHHFLYPDGLRAAVADVREGRGFVDRDELLADVGASLQRARKALGPVQAPRTLAEVDQVADLVADHCGRLVERWDGLGTKRYRSTATDQRAKGAALRRKGATEDEIRDELASLARGASKRRRR